MQYNMLLVSTSCRVSIRPNYTNQRGLVLVLLFRNYGKASLVVHHFILSKNDDNIIYFAFMNVTAELYK